MLIDNIEIPVTDPDAVRRFYESVLAPLGVAQRFEVRLSLLFAMADGHVHRVARLAGDDRMIVTA